MARAEATSGVGGAPPTRALLLLQSPRRTPAWRRAESTPRACPIPRTHAHGLPIHMQRRGRCLRPRASLTGRPTSYVSQTCTAGCYAAALDLILIVLAVHTAGRKRRSRSMHLRASGMRVRATRKEQSSGPSEVVYSPTHLDQRLDTLVAAGALCSGHRRRPQLFIYTRARAVAQHDQSSRG